MDECKPLMLGQSFGGFCIVRYLSVAPEAGHPNRPISVYRLCEMPIQSRGQSVSAARKNAGARLNVHTELLAKRQRSAWEAIYRNQPIGPFSD